MKESTVTNHRGRLPELMALSDQIRKAFEMYKNFSELKGSGGGHAAAMAEAELIKQRETLAAQIEQYFTEEKEIETWLCDAVTDPIMRTIIRARYLNGESWAGTAAIVYGTGSSEDSVRIYYGRHKGKIYQ